MANVLGSLTVDLLANTGKFESGMSDAARAAMKSSRQIHESFQRMGQIAQDALAPLGNLGQEISATLGEIGHAASAAMAKFRELGAATRVVAGVGAGLAVAAGAIGVGLFEAANKAAEFGSKIFEASEKTGMSASNLSGLAAVSKSVGESFDTLTDALARAGKNLKEALIEPGEISAKVLAGVMGSSKNLAALGLLPMDEAIQKVLARIFALNDVGERNLALNSLLGRGWMTNVETLKLLAEQGYGPAIEQAKKFGMFFNDEAARQAKQYTVEMADLKAQISGLSLTVGQKAIPAMSNFAATLANLGKAARGLAADIGVLASIGSGPGAMLAAIAKDKAVWDDYVKGVADFKKSAADMAKGEKEASDASSKLATQVQKVGRAHHEAVPKVADLDRVFTTIVPHIETVESALPGLAESKWDEKIRGIAEAVYSMQQGEAPSFPQLAMPMPALTPEQLDPFGTIAKSLKDVPGPPIDTLRDKFQRFFADIEQQGQDFGDKVFASLSQAVDGISEQLARLVVTGKANFRELFAGVEQQIIKSGIQKAFGQLAAAAIGHPASQGGGQQTQTQSPGGLRGVFGTIFGHLAGGKPGGQQRGNTPQNPLYVVDAGGGSGGKGGVSGGLLSKLFSKKSGSEDDNGDDGYDGNGDGGDDDGGDGGGLSGAFSSMFSGMQNVFGKLASLMKSAFSGIAGLFSGLFGGGRAGGGDVTPGKAYIVGEHHPEFFVPRQPGHVAPALQMGGNHQTVLNFHVHGVQDFDSFKRSQGQVMALLQNQLATAYTRNR